MKWPFNQEEVSPSFPAQKPDKIYDELKGHLKGTKLEGPKLVRELARRGIKNARPINIARAQDWISSEE
jgi:hypothetical protein